MAPCEAVNLHGQASEEMAFIRNYLHVLVWVTLELRFASCGKQSSQRINIIVGE